MALITDALELLLWCAVEQHKARVYEKGGDPLLVLRMHLDWHRPRSLLEAKLDDERERLFASAKEASVFGVRGRVQRSLS